MNNLTHKLFNSRINISGTLSPAGADRVALIIAWTSCIYVAVICSAFFLATIAY